MSGVITAAVIAAAATYENNKQVAHRQDSQLAASLRQQGQLQQQANQKTGDLIKKTAASTDTGAKSSLLDQFMQQMQAKSGNTQPAAQVGNVAGAYTKAANDAALGVSQFGDNRASTLASIDAPALQRQAEAADLMRYGTDVGQLKQLSASDEFLTNMRLRGIRPNPWLTAVSSAAGAYSRSGAGAGGSTSGSGVDPWSQGNTTSAGGGFTYNMPNT